MNELRLGFTKHPQFYPKKRDFIFTSQCKTAEADLAFKTNKGLKESEDTGKSGLLEASIIVYLVNPRDVGKPTRALSCVLAAPLAPLKA